MTGLSFGVTTTTKYLLLVLDIASRMDEAHTARLELTDASFITSDGTVASTNFTIKNETDMPVPVELTSFTASVDRSGSVVLERVTTDIEIENLGFILERRDESGISSSSPKDPGE